MKKIFLIMIMLSFSLLFAQNYIVLDVHQNTIMIDEQSAQCDSVDLQFIEIAKAEFPGLQYVVIDAKNNKTTFEYTKNGISGLKQQFDYLPDFVKAYLKNKG